MKQIKFILSLVIASLISGCAHEAICVDREYGMANRDAFDRQIVYKDYKYAGQPVDGLDGIYVEPTMGKYLETYSEGFTKENVDIQSVGIEEN